MENENNIIPQKETLSTFVTFRLKPSDWKKLAATVARVKMTRSALIRTTLANAGVVFVGNDLVEGIADCRRDVARAGNLLKMISGELQTLNDNPLLADEEKDLVDGLLDRVGEAADELIRARVSLVGMIETLNDKLEAMNHGHF